MPAALGDHLWQSTLFAAAVALLTLGFRRNRAGVRYALWLCASVKFLVPLSLLISLGSQWHWTSAADRIASRVVAPQALPFTVVEIARPFSAAPAPQANYAPFFVAVWAVGFLLVAFLRLRGWLAIRAAMRSSTALPIPAAIDVRSSPALLEPGVVGFWRPILLLPAGILDRLSGAQLESVLGHELSHVRRRDNLTSLVHMLVEATFWFHPFVWWIGARLVEERERACDEAVLTLGSQPRDYADAILNVCRLYAESPLVCVAGVTGANLKRRIEAIMLNRTGQSLNNARKLLLAVAAAAAVAGPILIGVGHAPAIHAQPAAAPVVAITPPDQPMPAPAPALATPQPQAAPTPQPAGHFMVMLFDLTGMSADEQSRARQTAVTTIQTQGPNTSTGIFWVDGGVVKVAVDFTTNKAVLESAILGLTPSASGAPSARLANLRAAVRLLGALPGKKSLMYFTTPGMRPANENQAEVRDTIAAAQTANVAIYQISVSTTPLASYEGRPEVAAALVDALNREMQQPASSPAAIPGLPGAHASIETFAQIDRSSPVNHRIDLVVPLGSLSGNVDILGEIAADSGDKPVANVRDRIEAARSIWRTSFMLEPGVYTCRLIVREGATGRTYGETVSFTLN